MHHIADDEQGKGTGRSRNPHWAAGVGIVAEGIGGSMLRLRVGMLRPHSVVRLCGRRHVAEESALELEPGG